MVASHRVIVPAFCGALGAGVAHAEAPRRRTDVSLGLGAVFLAESDYDETLRVFDQLPLSAAFTLSLQGVWYVRPSIALGGRAGWLWTESNGRTTSAAPVGTLAFNLVDLSAVARFIPTRPPVEGWGWRVHFDLEGGVVLGAVTLASVDQWLVRPRVGGTMFAGAQLADGVFIGLRLGGQWISWNGAGESSLDPVFSGVHLGLEGGFVR